MAESTATPTLTEEEALAVVKEADRLLKTEETWTTGTWKCPVHVTDDCGRIVRDEMKKPILKTDEQGRQVYAYCIEGAVNQAVVNLFGRERAVEIGALHPDALTIFQDVDDHDLPDKVLGRGEATFRISLDEVALRLYSHEIVRDEEDEGEIRGSAQAVNDDIGEFSEIKNILSVKLRELKARVRR